MIHLSVRTAISVQHRKTESEVGWVFSGNGGGVVERVDSQYFIKKFYGEYYAFRKMLLRIFEDAYPSVLVQLQSPTKKRKL
jgi:hypothetical protein